MSTLTGEDLDIKLFRGIRDGAENRELIGASKNADEKRGSSALELLENEYVDWLNELVAEGRGRHVPRRH